MKLRKGHAAICVAAAFAGGAVFAAIGLGEKSGDVRASLDRDTEGVVSVREVKAPSAGAPGSALAQTAKKKKGVRIRYFEETAATTIADQEERIATLPCPAKTKAINGYAVSFDTAVLVDYSAVSGLGGGVNLRQWTIGVINGTGGVLGTGADRDVAFGIVCAQGVK